MHQPERQAKPGQAPTGTVIPVILPPTLFDADLLEVLTGKPYLKTNAEQQGATATVYISAAISRPASCVLAVPPRSPVRLDGCARLRSTALTMSAAASFSPR
jgi:hypothetical protein